MREGRLFLDHPGSVFEAYLLRLWDSNISATHLRGRCGGCDRAEDWACTGLSMGVSGGVG